MKISENLKKLSVFVVYVIFAFLTRVTAISNAYPETVNSLQDTLNLLFLNTKELWKYHIHIPDYMGTALFALFVFLLINYFYNASNEYRSFTLLKMYRTGRIKAFASCVKREIKQSLLVYITLSITIVLCSLFQTKITAAGISLLALYLLKLLIVFFTVSLVYDIGSLLGAHTQISFLGAAIPMLCLVSDSGGLTHIITYSNNTQAEIAAAACLFIVSVLTALACYYLLKTKGDTL